MSSDSEDEDIAFDEDGSDQDNEIDEDILGALEEDLAAEASEADEVGWLGLMVDPTNYYR